MRPTVLAALAFCAMAAATTAHVFGVLVSPIASDLERSVGLIGGLRTISAVASIAVAIPLSRIADRVPRKRLIMVGFAIMALAAATAAMASSVQALLPFFLLAGISDIVLLSTILASPGDFASGRSLARATGIVIAAFGLPGIVVAPIAGMLTDAYSWRVGIATCAVVALIGLVVVWFVLPEVSPAATDRPGMIEHLRAIAARPGLPLIVSSNVLRFGIDHALVVFGIAYLIDRFEISEARSGIAFGIGSVVFLVSAGASGFVLERIGVRRVLIYGGVALVFLAAATMVSVVPPTAAVIALLTTVSMLAIHENGTFTLIVRSAGPLRGAATSINELGAALAGLAGAGIGGVVVSIGGFNALGLYLGSLALAALLVTYMSISRLEAAGGTTS